MEESHLLSSLAISLPCHSDLLLDTCRCAVSVTPMSSEPLKDKKPSPPAPHPTAGHLTTQWAVLELTVLFIAHQWVLEWQHSGAAWAGQHHFSSKCSFSPKASMACPGSTSLCSSLQVPLQCFLSSSPRTSRNVQRPCFQKCLSKIKDGSLISVTSHV